MLTAAQYRQSLPPAAPQGASGTGVAQDCQRPAGGTKPRKVARHDEDDLQASIVKWFRYQYPEYAGNLWSCPNGGARNKITAALMKRTGQLAGVADLHLAIVRPHAPALFLELKVGKNKVSDAQRDFLQRMQAQGYATAVAYDFNAARAAIVNHIGY